METCRLNSFTVLRVYEIKCKRGGTGDYYYNSKQDGVEGAEGQRVLTGVWNDDSDLCS